MAAPWSHLEVKEDLIPLVVLLKMRIRHGDALAPEIAELKVVRRHHRNRMRQRQATDRLTRADNAVGRVRPAENLINQDQHRFAALAVDHHLLDAQELRIERRNPAREIVADLNRRIDRHRRERKGARTYRRTRIREDSIRAEAAHIGRLAGHIRPRDDERPCRELRVVRRRRLLRQEQQRRVLRHELRRALLRKARERVHLTRMPDAREREQHLRLRPHLQPVGRRRTVALAPVGKIRHAVKIPEQNPICQQKEKEIAPHRRTVGENRQAAQPDGRAHGRKERRQNRVKRSTAQRGALERTKDPPIEPQRTRHAAERCQLALRPREKRHRHREIERKERNRNHPAAAKENRPKQ